MSAFTRVFRRAMPGHDGISVNVNPVRICRSAPRFRHGLAAANRAISAQPPLRAVLLSVQHSTMTTAEPNHVKRSIGFINWAHAIDHYVMLIFPTVVIGLERGLRP